MVKLLGVKYMDTGDIKKALRKKYKKGERDFAGNVSLIGATFVVDKMSILREPNEDYINRELDWYRSQSRNVNDIPGGAPKIWKQCADKQGIINSNYGWCIWSKANGNQYDKAINALAMDKGSRQAIMYFTRPTMHEDAVKNGRHDHMCTYNYNLKIENDNLYLMVNMRSNDAVFGYNNDVAFADYVFNLALKDLQKYFPSLRKGAIIWHSDNFHVYPRHFELLK
jgi:thymidylate synthase